MYLCVCSQGPNEATIFVGDLPSHCTQHELKRLFYHWGPVASCRVVGAQCYGFVTFQHLDDAQSVLMTASQQPIVIDGQPVRVNRAYGSMPEWKVQSQLCCYSLQCSLSI